jgi:hypothetical protein
MGALTRTRHKNQHFPVSGWALVCSVDPISVCMGVNDKNVEYTLLEDPFIDFWLCKKGALDYTLISLNIHMISGMELSIINLNVSNKKWYMFCKKHKHKLIRWLAPSLPSTICWIYYRTTRCVKNASLSSLNEASVCIILLSKCEKWSSPKTVCDLCIKNIDEILYFKNIENDECHSLVHDTMQLTRAIGAEMSSCCTSRVCHISPRPQTSPPSHPLCDQ